ncbi:uncharacterized protein DUF1801 [Yoonia maricola]|uniref:Uncharacterized protein DUF1801 n=1 Tax=Yoonia maricola TaxID=420999 RepID=A0A2M8WPN5_9RHOB|nr:DUF1801 domain-containing protein [Yoonia maricola]PJI92883.1 uncharacterized protein DUF1801 [Yoonia maricola]
MADNKTKATTQSVDDFLDAVDHPVRQADAQTLNQLFQDVTGWRPQMWGHSIIGYGQYHYTYDSGRSGDFLATGFSPRKANLSIYIMPGYADFKAILARLGKHKIGKSCLYVNKLADIDMAVLEELIHAGLADLGSRWPIMPT